MAELERELLALGRELDYPPTPDVAGAVSGRLARTRAPRGWWVRRRAVALAFVVLAAALAGVLAVPQARTAVLEWLGLRGVAVKRVETLPPSRAAGLELGQLVRIERAQRFVPYRIQLPDTERGEPDRVYLNFRVAGGQVALLLTDGGKRVLFIQFRGSHVAEKLVGPQTTLERLTVDGAPALWISGRPHSFIYREPGGNVAAEEFRLAGNVLLWERDGLTFRLEGPLTKERALEIARSVD